MPEEIQQLPADVVQCHAVIREFQKNAEKDQSLIRKLQHQVAQLLRRQYGQRSDRIDPKQLVFEAMQDLLNAAQGTSDDTADEQAEEPAQDKQKKKRPGHGRREIPPDAEIRRTVHDVEAHEKICSDCGTEKECIGEDTRRRLDFVPAKIVVLEDVFPKYACKPCEIGVVQAARPPLPVARLLPAPGLLAHVITSKYADHLPLNRLEGIFDRFGFGISRKTMCGWMQTASELLYPLYDLMKNTALASHVIWTDDTPVAVQDRSLTKTRTGRIWVYVGDDFHPHVVYDYTANRCREGPVSFLGDYAGYMQADAFPGYDRIYGDLITEVACWAHSRRKYTEAQATDLVRSVIAVAWVKRLYEIEERAKDWSVTDRLAIRQEESKPILKDFHLWLQEEQTCTLPKSPIGGAIAYTLSNWTALNRYTEDGALTIDNNPAERQLRGIAVGRSNWLFFGSDRGGQTAARLLSLIATCKRHKVDPFLYLRDVIDRISDHPSQQLDELLPDKWKAARQPDPATN